MFYHLCVRSDCLIVLTAYCINIWVKVGKLNALYVWFIIIILVGVQPASSDGLPHTSGSNDATKPADQQSQPPQSIPSSMPMPPFMPGMPMPSMPGFPPGMFPPMMGMRPPPGMPGLLHSFLVLLLDIFCKCCFMCISHFANFQRQKVLLDGNWSIDF